MAWVLALVLYLLGAVGFHSLAEDSDILTWLSIMLWPVVVLWNEVADRFNGDGW